MQWASERGQRWYDYFNYVSSPCFILSTFIAEI